MSAAFQRVSGRAHQLHVSFHALQKITQPEWLRQEFIGTSLESLNSHNLPRKVRAKDDRHPLVSRSAAQISQTESPPSAGKMTSKTIRSGKIFRALSSASKPLGAVNTSYAPAASC